MTDKIDIKIGTTFDGKGASQAQRAAADLQRQQQSGAGATKSSTSSTLSLARAEASLAVAQGDRGRAMSILSDELSKHTERTTQTIGAQRQLTQIASGNINVLQGLKTTLGEVGIAFGAAAILKAGADLVTTGASADLVRQRFDQLAAASNTTGAALLSALKAASGGEISDLNLELAANRAQLLGVAKSANEMGVLMGIARDRAQQMGISTTQAFNDLVTGLGRGSPLILDNLGILVSVDEANKTYAASLGKTAGALTEAEKKQALINQVLAQGQASLAATGGAVDTTAGKIQSLAASFENLKAAAGSLGADLLAEPIAKLATFVQGGADGAAQIGSVGEKLADVTNRIVSGSSSWDEYAAKVDATNQKLFEQFGLLGLFAPQLTQMTQAEYEQAKAQAAIAKQKIDDTNEQQLLRTAQAAYQASIAVRAVASALDLAAKAAGTDAVSQQLDATKADLLAIQKQRLQEEAKKTADALMAGGASAKAASQQLANSSPDVQKLVQSYVMLAHAQAAQNTAAIVQAHRDQGMALADNAVKLRLLTNELAQLAPATVPYIEKQTEIIRLQRTIDQETRATAQAITQAQRDQLRALGGTGGAFAAVREELRQLVPGTAAYIQKQTELFQLIQKETDARAAAAQKTREIVTTEQTSIRDVQQQAAEKLIAIDAETAEKQRDITRETATAIASIASDQAERLTEIDRETQAKRAELARDTASTLLTIERDTTTKIYEINKAAEDKITAFDQDAITKRAAAYRQLGDDIRRTLARMVADQEANDLELVGATGADQERLQAREKAEAATRAATRAATQAAIRDAQTMDSQAAQDILAAKQDAIAKQQSLDESYAQRQRDLAGDPALLAELQQQYREATAAIQQGVTDETTMARAAFEQRRALATQERTAIMTEAEEQRAAVIAAAALQRTEVQRLAAEQANALALSAGQQRASVIMAANEQTDSTIAAAEEQRAGVVAAAEQQRMEITSAASQQLIAVRQAAQEQRAAVVASLNEQSAAAQSWATQYEQAAYRVATAAARAASVMSQQTGSISSSSGSHAAGGGSFITSKRTSLTVGDNPGGRELVSVLPLGSAGMTHISPSSGLYPFSSAVQPAPSASPVAPAAAGAVTYQITVNAPQAQSPQQIASLVMKQISQATQSRR